MKTSEEWRDIPGCKAYQISTFGNVRTCRERGGRLLSKYYMVTPNITPDGWLKVSVFMDSGIRYSVHVTTLMKWTFFPEAGRRKLRHLNGNALDCRLSNLAIIEKGSTAAKKKATKQVEKFGRDGEVIETYASTKEAAEKNYFSESGIYYHCAGNAKKRLTALGYGFRYKET